jgi:hypothetical protein
MPPETNDTVTNEFLKDLEVPQSKDIFEQPLVDEPGVTQPPADTTAQVVEPKDEPKNRRERRLEAKLQAERESSIALAARLEAITEAQRQQRETAPSEYVKQIERIYGTNTPEAQEATNLLVSALKGAEDRATERALEAFREEQRKAKEEEANEAKALDEMVDDIEDTYGVTLDDMSRKAFFQELERVSPKDRNGEIIAYADGHAVFEGLQARRHAAQPQTRAKDLASRGMVKTGAQAATTVQDDAQERWLKENGII